MRRFVSVTAEVSLLIGSLSLAAVAATYPLIRHMTTHLPNDLGDPVLVAWILGWDAEAIRHGAAQIFNAPSFFPYLHTLTFSEHLFGLAIFTAPLQWLSANPVLVYNIAFIVSFVQAGAGMYLLARALTGRRDAALLAAFAYAFTPARVAQFAHLQWLMTGWLPLSLWALHTYFSTGAFRYLAASAVAYLLQSLTSSYLTYFALLPLATVAIAGTWQTRPPLGRTIAHAAAAVALCALVLAPFGYAYYRARADHDFRRPASEIAALSADLGDYARAHNHVWLWRHARPGTGEHELFPGAIVVALAGVALFTARGIPASRVHLYAVIAAAALVLSLGPEPTAWGHPAAVPGPYRLLLAITPGLDGLRAVARLGLIALLGLCVLAAFGAIPLLDCLAKGRRRLLVAGLSIGMVAEGFAAPIPTARFDPLANPDDRHAYDFLRQSGPDGAVLELPMSVADDLRELRYQYVTLWHGHRTVNGSSGYTPPLALLLGSADQSPFADPTRLGAAVEFVRNIGVRYLVVHTGAFEHAEGAAALLSELEGHRHSVVTKHGFGGTIVFTLAPDTVRPVLTAELPIPASAIRARASQSSDRLPLLFDGDRDTRWLTGSRQTGTEWIELELDSPRNVSAVRMQSAERSFGDFPRELAVDIVEGGHVRTLFQGSVLPQFGHGFSADQRYPVIEVDLPDNHAEVLRLRQLGTTATVFWSIHELELRERSAGRP